MKHTFTPDVLFILKSNSLVYCVYLKLDLQNFNTTKICHLQKKWKLLPIQAAAQMTCLRQYV